MRTSFDTVLFSLLKEIIACSFKICPYKKSKSCNSFFYHATYNEAKKGIILLPWLDITKML